MCVCVAAGSADGCCGLSEIADPLSRATQLKLYILPSF